MTNKLNYTYLDRINNALSFPSQTTPLSPAHGLISNTNNKLVLLRDRSKSFIQGHKVIFGKMAR